MVLWVRRYLEDQFSLIETRLRMKKVDSEEDTSFRADQRKPESILRELRCVRCGGGGVRVCRAGLMGMKQGQGAQY